MSIGARELARATRLHTDDNMKVENITKPDEKKSRLTIFGRNSLVAFSLSFSTSILISEEFSICLFHDDDDAHTVCSRMCRNESKFDAFSSK